MLMRAELGVLLLGAREAVYALDIDDVSVRKAAVRTALEPLINTHTAAQLPCKWFPAA